MMHLTRQRVGTRVCGGRAMSEDVRGGLVVALWWRIPVVGLTGSDMGQVTVGGGFAETSSEGW